LNQPAKKRGNPNWHTGMEKVAGRRPGSPNKLPTEAKKVIAEAASRLGGVERIVQWVKDDTTGENERIFWGRIYTKLIPLQVQGDPDAPIIHQIEKIIVRPRPQQMIDVTPQKKSGTG
jgi:hypothetical protein